MVNYRQRLYENYVATHFASIRDISLAACDRQRRIFRAYFRRFLPERRSGKILDIGCGFGAFLYFVQKEGYSDVHGVDISPEQVEAARRLGMRNVYCEDLAMFLKRHTEEFDCITAFDVVEHFPKQEVLPLLDDIYGALQPGGTFLLQAPNGASPFCGAIRYSDFTHSVAFTKESIAQILAETGFIDVQVYPTGPVVHGVMSAGRWALWQVFCFLLQLYLLAETGLFRGHILTQNLIAVARKPCLSRISV
jgi:2-polyprenyl-3-methyl-5-hydroxy-6-metoxy-1,4-benzoquinol methylase